MGTTSFLSMMEARMPPGFRFHPRDEELIVDYLAKRISSSGCQMMIDVDLNKVEPWDLPGEACVGGKEWYFYSLRDRKYATGQRTNRATVSGYWKATGKDRPVIDSRRINNNNGAILVGMRKTLVFYKGRAPKGKKTDWVMHEFRIETTPQDYKPSSSSSSLSSSSKVIPTRMKRVAEDEDVGAVDGAVSEEEDVEVVVRGFIKNWDAMEDLLHHVLYSRLGWEFGNEGQILFTEPLLTPKALREQLVQLMFETFNISGFYASEQAVLSLYAVGRISGCTVDIGHGKIDIAPVCEGAVQHIASKRFEIGGIDLTNLLARELRKSNPSIDISISDVEKIKEQFACCCDDQYAYEHTQNSCQEEKHILPDGQVIAIRRERYTVGEALFQPSILGLEEYGVVEQLVRCISSVSSENHRQLLENTVLCGGTVSMTGFEERFQREANLCSSSIRPSLVKPPEYMPENLLTNSAWMGGAILAKVVFPQNQHITKGEYDETGPSIVHKKCF